MASAKYVTAKKYFDMGFWTLENGKIQNAVEKGWITKAEFKKITGKKYE